MENGKSPACPNGEHDATTDPEIIARWWSENPEYNIGFPPGKAGLCVVDLDTYKDGFTRPGGILDTFTVLSPRMGEHHYFSGSGRATQGNVLGIGIDTRGETGYVLLPPSRTPEGEYQLLHDRPFAPLPEWITTKLARPERKAALVTDLDLPASIARAQEFLKRQPTATAGESGNNRTFATACALFDLGLSVEKALETVAEWNQRCDPPWTDDELDTIFHNAWSYRHDEIGIEATRPASEVFSGMVASSVPKASLRPLTIPEIRARAAKEKSPEYLWQQRLLKNETNLWTGDAGIGKTTLIENMAVSISAGTSLLGRTTVKTPVLLFVGEDRYKAVLANLDGIAAARGLHLDSLPIKVFSTDSEDCEHLLATISDDGDIFVTDFFHDVFEPALDSNRGSLVVLDPLAEFIHFDHNQDKAARSCFRGFLTSLARNFDITPLVTDHPSKTSMGTGEFYGGSREMKASPASFATLRLTDPKDKGLAGRKALTFEVIKSRYAPPSELNFFHQGSPAYKLDPLDNLTLAEINNVVLEHILLRIDAGLTVGKNSHTYGPEQAADALGITARNWQKAIERLAENGFITYQVDPGKREPSSWVRGPKLKEIP